MTFGALPDNVLLETFELYLAFDYFGYEWQTLVHVCRRWRCIVFASPRRLNLKLCCTQQRSVNSKTLDIWPALPIVVVAQDLRSKEDVTNIMAALRHHDRVYEIHHNQCQGYQFLLEEVVKIDNPFPVLTILHLESFLTA